MAARFIRPLSPFVAPPGLTSSDVPLSAIPFDANAPSTEIIDKGQQYSHTATKSTVNDPSGYQAPDACGNLYYSKVNVASNINQTVDCNIVSIFQGSLSVTVPEDITALELAEFVATLTALVMTKLTELAV